MGGPLHLVGDLEIPEGHFGFDCCLIYFVYLGFGRFLFVCFVFNWLYTKTGDFVFYFLIGCLGGENFYRLRKRTVNGF